MANESRWVEFDASAAVSWRTKRWAVISKQHGHLLGVIRWYGQWWQYVFEPQPETLFSHECLEDISKFLVERNETFRPRRNPSLAEGHSRLG